MSIVCFGLSHQTASVEIREQYAIPDSSLHEALQRLRSMRGVEECLILSTCNRTEFYVAGNLEVSAAAFSNAFYQEEHNTDVLFQLKAEQCFGHLFRLTSGLESMVLGETEIFGQVKRAYEAACRAQTTGRLLNKLFQKSFQVGKLIRSTTTVGYGSVSVGSVAVDLASQIFGKLRGCKVMVIGAGETSEKTARAFASRGVSQILVSNRSYDRAAALATDLNARAIRFEQWEQEFFDLDILVSSTAAPHPIVTVEKLTPILKNRRERPLFMIDLAMPRDIEPAVHGLDGVFVYDLDALQTIAQRSMGDRRRQAEGCDQVIQKHVLQFAEWASQVATPAGRPIVVEAPGAG